jgi:hypothetical protein
MENTNTASIFLRCPETLNEQLKAESKLLGFRSVQEYILQILRERKPQGEQSTNKLPEKLAA